MRAVSDAGAAVGDRWIEGDVRLVYVLDPPGVAVGGFRLTEDDGLFPLLHPDTDPDSVAVPAWPSSSTAVAPVPRVPAREKVDGLLTRVARVVLTEIQAGSSETSLLRRVGRTLLADPAVRSMAIDGRTASLDLGGLDPVTLRVRIPDERGMTRIRAHVEAELDRAAARLAPRGGPVGELVSSLVPETRGRGVLAWLLRILEHDLADPSRAADAVGALATARALDPDSAVVTPYPGRASDARVVSATHPDRAGWIAVAARGVELRTLLDRVEATTGLVIDTDFELRRHRVTVFTPGFEPPMVAVRTIGHAGGMRVVPDPERSGRVRLSSVPALDPHTMPREGRRLWASAPRQVEADWLVCGAGICGIPHANGGLDLRDWRTGEVTSRLPGPSLGAPHVDPTGGGLRIGVAGGGEVVVDLTTERWWSRRRVTAIPLLGPIDGLPEVPGEPLVRIRHTRVSWTDEPGVAPFHRYAVTAGDGTILDAGATADGVRVLHASHPDGRSWTTPLPSIPTSLVVMEDGEEVVVPGEDGYAVRIRMEDGAILARVPLDVPHGAPAVSVGVAVFHVTRGGGIGASTVR